MDVILKRRSIRKYQDKEVSESKINEILKAAMSAPSAGNQQPWHFIVIDDKQKLDKITEIHSYAKMAGDCDKAILVCGDLSLETHEGFWVQDCSAATQNILLAIEHKGLGGVWVGIYPRENRINNFKELFALPENVIPFSLIPLGYPAEKKSPADRFNESRIHKNEW